MSQQPLALHLQFLRLCGACVQTLQLLVALQVLNSSADLPCCISLGNLCRSYVQITCARPVILEHEVRQAKRPSKPEWHANAGLKLLLLEHVIRQAKRPSKPEWHANAGLKIVTGVSTHMNIDTLERPYTAL